MPALRAASNRFELLHAAGARTHLRAALFLCTACPDGSNYHFFQQSLRISGENYEDLQTHLAPSAVGNPADGRVRCPGAICAGDTGRSSA
jgi:hypothetical protein